ncbi:OB-fold protein [Burkholderia diffusa]|uniref:OB-fold protein n=1 Tax=Burkholderia diffusa TaxID=488732 RepID=UPI0009BCF772|nr:hypothetical protein [Burkholderia diffusa]
MVDVAPYFQYVKVIFRVKLCVALIAAFASEFCVADDSVPSEVESSLLTLIRQDDVHAFATGQQSYVAQTLNIDVTTAPEIARAYRSRDDAKANQRFLSRRVLISGAIDALWSDGPNRTVLIYADTGATQVRAIVRGKQPRTAWRVGSRVTLVCTGAGGTSRAASFDDCEIADNVARREWKRLDAWFADFYRGKYVPNIMIVTMAINVAARASRMPAGYRCAESPEKCREALIATGALTSDKDLLNGIVGRFKAIGLDLSLLAPIQPRS